MEYGDGSDPGFGLDPEAVEETDFATVRRGYEPGPVRNRLREAAEEIRRLNTLAGSLSKRIAELEDTPAERLESRRVAEALGDEATRVLQSASDAAQERIERAEAECGQIVDKAEAAAAAITEEGREQGRNMVFEARNVRERILADLARKRHEHRVEVEQLRVMRDRLLEVLGICRQGLDGWIEELVEAEPRAAAAAEQAGLRVAAQPEATVAEIEAEISAARLAGMSLDSGPDEGAPAPDDAPAGAAPEEPEEEGEAEEAGTPPVAADEVESETLEDLDELEAMDEYVEMVGVAVEPALPKPAAAAAVPLYDVEAEPEPEFDSGAGLLLAGQTSDAAGDASLAVSDVTESAAEAASASDAEAIFARLRSITDRPVRDPAESPSAESPSAEPPATGDGASPSAMAEAASEPDEFADEIDDVADEFADEVDDVADESEAALEPSDPDDLVGAARAVAVGGIARRLKRLVVDEQGDLLDAIRRNGTRAVRSAITGDTKSYTRTVRVPMQDFASDIDVSIDDIDLEAAGGAILSILVEPVRARLGDLAESTDDPDELSSAVRSIYRESRSRRADSAAESAFSAGWPEPIT